MAVPGFSVSELITATTHVKHLYDAFFSKHTSSAAQIRDLADDIVLFRNNLRLHQGIIEDRGLDYDGYRMIERTLAECADFLNEYSVVLDGKKFSAVGAWKTALYSYEGDKAKRLQERIRSHYHTLHFSMTAMSLKELSQPSLTTSTPVTIRNVPNKTISPPMSPQLLSESPRSEQELRPPLTSESPQLSAGLLSRSPDAVSTTGPSSPWQTPPMAAIGSRKDSIHRSPRSTLYGPSNFDLSRQNSTTSFILPQPALPYVVAKLYFDSKMVDLKRKAMGRDFGKGRELVIVTESGSPRLHHQIKHPAKQDYYPYTWHRRWKDHQLEVTFQGIPVECHSIKINGQAQSLGFKTPSYVFTNSKDYVEFQSQVRGKELVAYFEFKQIKTWSSARNGEATDQHLKIWRHGITQGYSISFYASAAENAGDLEFPISMFNQDFESKDEAKVNLDFTIAVESKRTNAKKQSRSGTVTTATSSEVSSDAAIFSRAQTGLSIAPSIVTTVTSRLSAGSFGSIDGSPPQTDGLKNGLTVLEAQAKKMRYLSIEFSDKQEAFGFQRVFERVYKEEIFPPSEFCENWRIETDAAAAGRARSSISNASVPGTPLFYMSPIINSQQSPVHSQRQDA